MFWRNKYIKNGNLIKNAIAIDERDYIAGVLEEHDYIDPICSSIKGEVECV